MGPGGLLATDLGHSAAHCLLRDYLIIMGRQGSPVPNKALGSFHSWGKVTPACCPLPAGSSPRVCCHLVWPLTCFEARLLASEMRWRPTLLCKSWRSGAVVLAAVRLHVCTHAHMTACLLAKAPSGPFKRASNYNVAPSPCCHTADSSVPDAGRTAVQALEFDFFNLASLCWHSSTAFQKIPK